MRSWCALFLLPLLFGICSAQAEECSEAEKLSKSGKDFWVELCKSTNLPAEEGKTLVLIKLYKSKSSAAIKLELPLEVEGALGKIVLDTVNYPVSKQFLVFGLLVEARLPGSSFDQYTRDLHLIMLGKDQQLRHIFSLNTEHSVWGRQCESDCQDTSKSKSIVLISPKRSKALHDLIVHTKSEVNPYGSEKISEKSSFRMRYVWNGNNYEKAQ